MEVVIGKILIFWVKWSHKWPEIIIFIPEVIETEWFTHMEYFFLSHYTKYIGTGKIMTEWFIPSCPGASKSTCWNCDGHFLVWMEEKKLGRDINSRGTLKPCTMPASCCAVPSWESQRHKRSSQWGRRGGRLQPRSSSRRPNLGPRLQNWAHQRNCTFHSFLKNRYCLLYWKELQWSWPWCRT